MMGFSRGDWVATRDKYSFCNTKGRCMISRETKSWVAALSSGLAKLVS
jgi:hypothetical protein